MGSSRGSLVDLELECGYPGDTTLVGHRAASGTSGPWNVHMGQTTCNEIELEATLRL